MEHLSWLRFEHSIHLSLHYILPSQGNTVKRKTNDEIQHRHKALKELKILQLDREGSDSSAEIYWLRKTERHRKGRLAVFQDRLS